MFMMFHSSDKHRPWLIGIFGILLAAGLAVWMIGG